MPHHSIWNAAEDNRTNAHDGIGTHLDAGSDAHSGSKPGTISARDGGTTQIKTGRTIVVIARAEIDPL